VNDDLLRDDVVTTIDRMVDDLLDRGGVREPPVDVIALAQGTLGMTVCIDSRQPQRGRAQRAAGKSVIYLKPEPSEERHQWTVAHEIGEHLKADLLGRLGVPPEETRAMAGESLANLLAYRLLVPTCWFAADARDCQFDVLELKKRYRTSSHEVIAWRFLDLAEPSIVTIVDNDSVTRRKSNAWPIRRKLEPVELRCQRFVHENSESAVMRDGGWTVHGWPVHQLDWKREILRSVVDEVD
jgi:Zn-dependent peptidase ImmA (M78 family)